MITCFPNIGWDVFVAVSYDTAQAFSLLISSWLTSFRVLNVCMLFSPCLKIFGTKHCAAFRVRSARNTVCSHNCGTSTECHFFIFFLICVPKQNFRQLWTNRLWRKDVGWRSWSSLKIQKIPTTVDLSWLSESRSPGIALAAFWYPWFKYHGVRLHQSQSNYRFKNHIPEA